MNLPHYLLLAVLLLPACTRQGGSEARPWPGVDSSYVFEQPDAVFELPKKLEEISGLTLLDERHLGAIQDEDGDLFVIDLGSGAVVREVTFAKGGDYEAVARAGDRLFILRSDGRLYDVAGWQADEVDARRHETGLKASCDAEGLVYQEAQHRLLVACKEKAGKKLDGYKAIYAYDLARGELFEEPAYLIDVERFSQSVRDDNPVDDRIRSALSPVVDLSGFKPSGLAIHPRTQQVYVLSSVRKAVVVLEASGEVVGVIALPDHLFAQPEGITFLPNGDLFISSEGTGGRAAILARFNERH